MACLAPSRACEWWVGPAGARTLVGFGAKPQDLTDAEQAMQRFSGYPPAGRRPVSDR
jgi:hypothetical protein